MAIIQGEAQVGKTCIKSLILKKRYSEVSTSCIEAPCIAFSINRYGSNDGISWRLVSDDEMDGIVIGELKKIASHSKKIDTVAEKAIEQNVSDIATMSHASEPTPEASHETPLTSTEEQNPGSIIANPPTKDSDKTIHVEEEELVEDKSVQNYDVLKYLKEKHRTSKTGFDKKWLYFFDSGGQIQFQKLLLAFMPGISVLILVVKLSKNLSAESELSMKIRRPDGKIERIIIDNYSLKVEDMLKQVLSAVASSTRHFISGTEGQSHIEAPKKLPVITIGTHRDLYDLIKNGTEIDLEEIEMKRKTLNSFLKSKFIPIVYKDGDQTAHPHPLHEVDGSKAERGEFDDDSAIKAINKALIEQAYKIKVPFKWHYFGVILRNEAKETGILDLSTCRWFGKLLGMSKKEVTSALQFFHALKLLFYYHDSPAKNIVFVKLDAIINIIRQLMITVCRPHSTLEAGPEELAQLASKGYLSMKVIKDYADGSALEGREDILLGLFEYLKIAALIPTDGSDQTHKEDKVFLMPALLPVKDVSDPSTFSKAPPLLYYFNDEPVPMGLFCAVIVQLLSYPGEEKWHIITERSYSNFFTIQKRYSLCQVILVEQLECIEIYCEHRFFKQNIKESIKKAIDHVMEHKLANNPAFYCPCNGKKDHIAKVEVQDGTNNVFIKCDTNGYQELSDSQCDWFMTHKVEEGEYEYNASSAAISYFLMYLIHYYR